MKKIISFILAFILILSLAPNVFAVGEITGVIRNTDIKAYVIGKPIKSYNVDNWTCIVAEDLRNFGFDVSWDGDSRSLTIIRNEQLDIVEQYVSKNEKTGSFFADTLEKLPSWAAICRQREEAEQKA